jgi:Fe-S-cluster containining protein
VSCKKGCAFCCNLKVDSTITEAEVIVDYCKENNIPLNKSYLEKQAKHTDQVEYMLSADSRCSFLQHDNTCAIYKVRPLACRKYYVSTPAERCNGKVYTNIQLAAHFDIDVEIMTGGVLLSENKQSILSGSIIKSHK